MVSAVCTDGAPAMIGCKSGLINLTKSVAPHIAFTHCMLHKHALVSKMLPSSLVDVLKIGVGTVTFVRGRVLNYRIFMQLCEEMDSKFKVLLYHIKVRWLSWRKAINHVFVLRAELLEFLKVTTIGIENTLRTQVLSLLSHFWLTSLVPSIN